MKNNKPKKIPVIDFTKCRKCKQCIKICPSQAISVSFNNCCAKCIKYCLTMEVPCQPKEIIFKHELCDTCGLCLKICPESAISWLAPRNVE
jgi:ferredoxin